ncbi:DUF4842 domain-containing protein [Prevotella communis]|uniref:DUF4842 domain-containing protein n=1 Tax=Prevotella communis TaxID=2913614 RepID=UPI001EDA83EE|nr:DUF4842 domain-containing protein [Prevotella communis]UKK56588.1 DUF4842 domain-containing protein [Prevotella communis]UKK67307.1 DUF4842 domain-containing protein [Prevotella communis]
MERILRYSMAALAMALFVGCSHDMEYSQPSKEQVQKNVAEKLGIEIDPNQNWNASTAITANVSVNLGLDQEYTLVIYDKNPLFEDDVFYYAKTVVKEGDTATLKLDVPSADSVFYAAVFDSKFRRLVQSAYREDSVLTMNFGTAASESRSNRAAENDADAAPYAKTLNDYLNPTGVESWKTVQQISIAQMKNYTVIDDDIVGSKFEGRSLQNPTYPGGVRTEYGDLQHYRVPANVELRQSFSTNGYSNTYNGLVLYIEGKVHLVGSNSLNDITLVVADGGEIILDAAENHFSGTGRFVVCPGGKITGINNAVFNVNNGGWCYNAGTIDYQGTLNLNGSHFYNNNTINVDVLKGTSQGTYFTNFGHITARTNAMEADAYNQNIVNGCYMKFTGNAGVGGLTMLKNSRLDVGGQLYITGNGLWGGFRNELHHLSLITAGSIKANGATLYGPTAYNEFAVVKVGSVYANNDTDLQTADNLYMDWNSANFYMHDGTKIDQNFYNYYYMRGMVNKISKWTNEDNSTFTIPRGDCTGNGYHDTSEVPSQVIPGEPAVWTYAFEDTPLGDYDMNDVVIKVSENAEDATRLDITLCCTGAANNLTVYLDDMVLFAGSGKEVHQVFGQASGKFINTVNDGIKVDPITETIRKPANFSFETADFWIKSPSGDVHVAKQGEDPHGIVVPGNWRWPREFQCIKDAYPNFIEFAKDASTTDDNIKKWYETSNGNPVEEYIYTPAN